MGLGDITLDSLTYVKHQEYLVMNVLDNGRRLASTAGPYVHKR